MFSHVKEKKHSVRTLKIKPAVFAGSPPASYFCNCLQGLYRHCFLHTSKHGASLEQLKGCPKLISITEATT